jgi:hypothetical protein
VSRAFQAILHALVEGEKLSSSKTLSSDSIGTSWRIWLKAASGAAPTRWVGESGVISSGCCALQLAQLAHQAVIFRIRALPARP